MRLFKWNGKENKEQSAQEFVKHRQIGVQRLLLPCQEYEQYPKFVVQASYKISEVHCTKARTSSFGH